LGGREKTPAIGFAMGIERILMLKQTVSTLETNNPDIYFICVGEAAEIEALKQAETLRTALPELRVMVNCGGGAFKNQFQRADKSEAKLALILGDDELAHKVIGVKFLREERSQEKMSFEKLLDFLKRNDHEFLNKSSLGNHSEFLKKPEKEI
jgi:histidyl-tRNA synthetase